MMAPTDEEEDVLFEQLRRPTKANGVEKKAASEYSATDDDEDDEDDDDGDRMRLLPNQSTRDPSKKKSRSPTKGARLLRTMLICLAFCCLGLCIALPGPTMLDLQERTHSNTESISRLFIGRSLGYLMGSIIGGFLFDRCSNRSCLLAASLLLAAVLNAAAPWSRQILVLIALLAAQGFFLGFMDTGGNMVCIQIWGRKSAPYMQTLHFFFGLGAFVAPLVSEPFLSSNTTSLTMHNGSGRSSTGGLGSLGVLNVPLTIRHLHKRDANGMDIVAATAHPNATATAVPTTATAVPVAVASTQALVKKPTKTSAKFLSKDTGTAAGHNVKQDFVKKVISEQNIVAIKIQQNLTTTTMAPTLQPSVTSLANATANSTNSIVAMTTPMSLPMTTVAATTTTTTPPPTTTTLAPTTTTTLAPTTTTTTTTTLAPTTTALPSSTSGPTVGTVPTNTVMVTTLHKPTFTGDFNNSRSRSYWSNLSVAIEDQIINAMFDIRHELTKVQFAYLIVSTFMLVIGFAFCADGCFHCCRKQLKFRKPNAKYKQKLRRQAGIGFNFQLISLLFFFFFFYVGIEVTYGGLVLAFVVDHAHWTKANGTYLNSVFWGCFALTRGVSIVLSKFVRPATMIILDLVITVAALLLLLVGPEQYAVTLWAGTALLGVGMASIFPTGISWAEQYIDVTGKVAATFITAAALGEMCLPALTGFLFEKKTPMFLIYVLFASALLCCVLYILMQNLASNRGEKYALLAHLPTTDAGVAVTDDDDIELTVVAGETRHHQLSNGSVTTLHNGCHGNNNKKWGGGGGGGQHAAANGKSLTSSNNDAGHRGNDGANGVKRVTFDLGPH